MSFWISISLTVIGLIAVVCMAVVLSKALNSPDGFVRIEGMVWASILITVAMGCMILSYLGVKL